MNKNLPIWERREEIIQAIKENDTVILSAETGSGKSTQVPQYLYEEGYDIIVTQPRRIACITLAERVAEEMNLSQDVVSYHTAVESTRTPSTKILFCTDGLQMAKGIKNFKNSILVLDEVHEWNLNIETLIAWVKKFREDGNSIKVVLMSATIDAEDLAKFYGEDSTECISIQGRLYDVEKFHKPTNSFVETIELYSNSGRNVLAFVPGKKEIADTIDELRYHCREAVILPLHGDLQSYEQTQCFKSYGKPKIIVSTNIAQTSVTIPDIDTVVDLGTEKHVVVENGIEGLFIHNISKADCLQRAGRAGRTKDGVYVLCSDSNIEQREDYPIPEIQRLALDKLVLKLLSVGIDAEYLDFYHQPSKDSILQAKKSLRLLGAIKNNELTEIGKQMNRMPVSVRFARMIIEADKLGCVSEILKAVSVMEIGTLVSSKSKPGYWGDAKWQYSDFVTESRSDILAEVQIYDNICAFKYKDLVESGINKKTFFRVKELHKKLKETLENYVDINSSTTDQFKLIRAIAAGLPDNLFKTGSYRGGCYNSSREELRLAKGTAVDIYSFSFVFGIPRTISFKDRWGDTRTMDIITMGTGVTKEQLIDIVGLENIDIELYDYNVSYNAETEIFSLCSTYTYNGFDIKEEWFDVDKNDPRYHEYMIRFSDVVEKAMRIFVKVGSTTYKITYRESIWSFIKDPYIFITNREDLITSDITERVDPNGERITWCYEGFRNTDLQLLKQEVIEYEEREKELNKPVEFTTDKSFRSSDDLVGAMRSSNQKRSIVTRTESVEESEQAKLRRKKKEMKAKIPKGKSSDIDEISNTLIPEMKEIEFDYPEFDMTGTKYVGLEFGDSSLMLKLYDDPQERDDESIEAMKRFVKKFVFDNYNDKTFIVKVAGQKIETIESKTAKDEFHQFTEEILEDMRTDNFKENVEMLVDFYHECIESVPHLAG